MPVEKLIELKSIGLGQSEDPKLIKVVLLLLYTFEELLNLSVTGKAAKNMPNTPQKKAMDPAF